MTLRDAINAADNTGGLGNSYVINLQANTTADDLTKVDNYWYGPDGLPAIAAAVTIQGNGSTVQRTALGTPDFRLFYVSGGFDGLAAGRLTLENLTLQRRRPGRQQRRRRRGLGRRRRDLESGSA